MKNTSFYLFIPLIILLGVSCFGSSKKDFHSIMETQKDSGYGKILTDSIVNIIVGAKSVKCELKSKNPQDTLRRDTIVNIPKKMLPILQYLFLNPENFQSDKVIYSPFDPWVEFKFKSRRKKELLLQLDLGSGKWQLLNKSEQKIAQGDLRNSKNQFLNFTQMLFPEDVTLKMLNENLKEIQK